MRLLAAQFEVGAGDFRGDRDLGVAQRGLGPLDLRALRLDIAAHASEEIELPVGIEPGVVEARVEGCARETLHLREALVGVTAGHGDRGRKVELRLATLGARLDEVAERDAQVMVGFQGLIDQPVERVIAEARPEPCLRVLVRIQSRRRRR